MSNERESMEFDVLIVGGGPAGSSTALHLTRAEGVDPSRVLVLDKSRHPREKPCAGAVSAWGVHALEAIRVPIGVPSVAMTGLRILSKRTPGTLQRAGLGVVVRRDQFDAHLLDVARSDGITVRDGEGVVAIRRDREAFVVTTTERTIVARFIAACDGTGSVVRKCFSLEEPARKGHLYVLESPERNEDAATRMGLCDFDLTPADVGLEGYYWDFPTLIGGERYVSRGIYSVNRAVRRQPASHVKDVLEASLAARGIRIKDVRLKPFSTRPFVRGTVLSLPRVVFVGEAAGIDRATGEGIAQALVFGSLAASSLSQALRRGASDVRDYDERVRTSLLGRHLLESAVLAEMVFGSRGRPFRRLLEDSDRARRAGAAWYAGERLGKRDKIALLGLLARATFAELRGSR